MSRAIAKRQWTCPRTRRGRSGSPPPNPFANQSISPDKLKGFARKARERMHLDDGYRRDHLRALAWRVEVADDEVRIMGSKSELLRTLVAASSVESAAFGVHSSVLKWRPRQDSNL